MVNLTTWGWEVTTRTRSVFLYWLGSVWWYPVFIFSDNIQVITESMFPDWERWKFIFPPDKHFLSFIYQIINNLRAIFYINDVLSVWRVCDLNSLYFISLSHLPTTTSLDSNLFPHTVFVPQENKPRENLILTGLVWSFIKKKLGRNKIKLDKTTTLKFTKSSRDKTKARKIWLSDRPN